MGTVLRIPTYTYYDNNTISKQSSLSFIMSDDLRTKMTDWYPHYGESGKVFEWTGTDIQGIPGLVNNALGFPLLSKKSIQPVIVIENDPNHVNPSILYPQCSDVLNRLYIDYQLHTGMDNPSVTRLYNPDNNKNLRVYNSGERNGQTRARDPSGVYYFFLGEYYDNFGFDTSDAKYYRFMYTIFPEDYIIGREFNPVYRQGGDHYSDSLYAITVHVECTTSGGTKITHVYITVNLHGDMASVAYLLNGMDNIGSSAQTLDTDNPYGEGGSATVGGGDGKYGDIDATDGTAVPDLPALSAVDTGFISLYNPTTANLKALYQFLWSNLFDLNTFKKLFADPMDCLISLGITPCVPASSGATNIMFGNVDSGVNATELSTQFAQVDCGSVDIDKYIGSFLDYSPFVKIQLFLPYIGFVHLGTDDIMGGSINVTYNCDCLSGECIAFVSHSSRGVLYSYHGNCRAELPITGANYAASLKNYYEQLSGIIPATINGASGGPMGAIAGFAGSALSAAESVMLNNKPDFQRSGSCAGSAGMIGVQTPFVVIERPRFSVPDKIQKYAGQTSNITMYLGDCSGYTAVDFVHLDGLNATADEITEIEDLLYKGVIL